MVLLDGKKLSEHILAGLKTEVAAMKKKIRLGVVVIGTDPVIEKFVAQKKKAAEEIGIDVRIYRFDEKVTTNELRKRIAELVHEPHNTGVIIQLPLPGHINKQYILNAIPPEKDVDVLSGRAIGSFIVGKSTVMPPVAGAIKTLLEEYKITYQNKHIAILGAGNLVGRPVALWLLQEGVTFSVITEETGHPEQLLQKADIVVSGIGKPHFVTGDMLKDGVIAIDAGTSESSGKLVGDIDPVSVAKQASHLTPVPGGVGPVTVAMLLKNLVTLAARKK
ncbi:MAG: bifunctional 5,10-methylenetetrahydrofolate dehydrogenase/5,10-methenyltetrahydrofolate cyclohydrolase [Candidatus Sungbacteria bacterium]|nr:bifunctional 5,10-methylenetetrahydrofolate dehydrogenase/5,10-methenyltetrahydrofolate cyclohydrolase [Candidatus Sungbacteria bacterium]